MAKQPLKKSKAKKPSKKTAKKSVQKSAVSKKKPVKKPPVTKTKSKVKPKGESKSKSKKTTPETIKKPEFTIKQQRFIDLYDGNGTETARKAGYKGSDNTLAKMAEQNLRKPQIWEAIQNRENKRNNKDIANREDRQEFWSRVLRGEEKTDVVIGRGEDRAVVKVDTSMSDRLKASELLGKSEADFTEKHEHTGKGGQRLFPELSDEELNARIDAKLAEDNE